MRKPFRIPAVSLLAACLLLAAMVSAATAQTTPGDTARFLAGLRPPSSSELAAAAQSPAWQTHAREMDAAWSAFDQRRMNRVRVWAAANLRQPRAAMFYMFSGPDFLHAEAFFPHASTYVLSGLEPVGGLPDATGLQPGDLAALRASLNNFLRYGYFITREMGQQFKAGSLTGTLPVLYVFLARAGKAIHEVAYVNVTRNGRIAVAKGKRANGVRITFSGRGGQRRRLYYFRTDLSDAGVKKSGFLKFCASLGQGDSLVKSASYLMHTGGFTRVRNFLLERSAAIVQDDSGIPLRFFDTARWSLHPFGQYLPPIEVFKERYQPGMAQLFQRAEPINFGIGYRWHPSRTNVLVAERLP